MHRFKMNPFKPVHRRRPFALALLPLFAAFALTLCAAPLQHTGLPRAQKHESHHEIDRMEEAWGNAFLKSNAAALDALLADDFMAITATGTLQSREQALASLRNGEYHLTSIVFSDRKVRFYGTTALVTSKADLSGTNAGEDISGSYRYTRVYVRDAQGKWKIVSFEASRITQPPESK